MNQPQKWKAWTTIAAAVEAINSWENFACLQPDAMIRTETDIEAERNRLGLNNKTTDLSCFVPALGESAQIRRYTIPLWDLAMRWVEKKIGEVEFVAGKAAILAEAEQEFLH